MFLRPDILAGFEGRMGIESTALLTRDSSLDNRDIDEKLELEKLGNRGEAPLSLVSEDSRPSMMMF